MGEFFLYFLVLRTSTKNPLKFSAFVMYFKFEYRKEALGLLLEKKIYFKPVLAAPPPPPSNSKFREFLIRFRGVIVITY